MDDLEFETLDLIRVPIKIGGVTKFILQEADEASVGAWENKRLASARYVGGTFAGPGPIADGRRFLMASCIYDLNDKLVPEEVIKKWPAKMSDRVWEQLKQISGIDPPDTIQSLEEQIKQLTGKLDKLKQAKDGDPEKNGQSDGRSTSTLLTS